MTHKTKNTLSWTLRVVLALGMIFMGALGKLTGDAMAVEVFELVGAPWARIPVGLIELAAGVLLLIPRTGFHGSALVAMSMLGAIGSHFATPLGLMPELTLADGTKEPQPMIVMAGVFLLMGVALAVYHRPRGGVASGAPTPAAA